MKLALLTDLHSNREALEAVLEHAAAQNLGHYAFLGDFVGYGADPAWVLDTVRRYVRDGAWAVLGNHDQAVLRGDAPEMRADARGTLAWTRAQLREADLAFLNQLPLVQQHGGLLFAHANTEAPGSWAYIRNRDDAVRSLQAQPCHYVFCGHSHEPRLYYLSGLAKAGDFVPTPETAIPVPAHRQWLAIPGSVGQPRDGNPAACYAVFDLDAQQICFHRVAYDHETAAAKIRAAGLPAVFAERLADGH